MRAAIISPVLGEEELETLDVVANCNMNRERELWGTNGYDRELGFDPLAWLLERPRPVRWLDLCCGTATALLIAVESLQARGETGVEIVGVDLVDMFRGSHPDLKLVVAPLREFGPLKDCDLISIVHGLHYVGDKLGALERVARWLKPDGKLVAQLDLHQIYVQGRPQRRRLIACLRAAGFDWDGRRHRVTIEGPPRALLGVEFVGAGRGGPNYTGQPAVRSDYSWA